MMKKLFLWSALLMTGFAFYSCDDQIDNPVQDESAVWTYSVNVSFADFDFNGLKDGDGNAYTYEAPEKLYVFNEQLQPLGTIAKATDPVAGESAKYSGQLKGAIGEKLIITTLTGTDYSKQDGTIESIIENGIVQSDTVAVKLYSNYHYTVTTENAKMKNEVAIAHLGTWSIGAGDELTITSDNIRTEGKALTITLNEKFDLDKGWSNLYIAIPTDGNEDAEYTLSSNKANGYVTGATFNKENYKLTIGKVNDIDNYKNPYWPSFQNIGVDLTKYDAYQREKNDATGVIGIWLGINDKKSFTVTQSGDKTLDSLNIGFSASYNTEATLNLDNIRLGKDRYCEVYGGGKLNINLIGENKFDILTLNTPFEKKGEGTWSFEQLNIGGGTYWTTEPIIYGAEYTINEDIELTHLSASNGAKLTIADGKKVNVVNKTGTAVSVYDATFNIGKGAKLNAESKAKNSTVISWQNSEINVGENAEVNALGGKDGTALQLYNDNYDEKSKSYTLNIGKNAKLNLVGGPEGILGTGLYIYNYYNVTTNINLDEGATLYAKGDDRYGIYTYVCDWSGNDWQGKVNIKAAKDAKIVCEDIEAGQGLYIYLSNNNLAFNFDGEGSFEVKSKDNIAMNISNYYGAVNFNGGNVSAISGTEQPAIWCSKKFTIAPEIKSFKAQKGATANLYISNGGLEALLEDLVADKTKFNDETKDGVRTITPKPAE